MGKINQYSVKTPSSAFFGNDEEDEEAINSIGLVKVKEDPKLSRCPICTKELPEYDMSHHRDSCLDYQVVQEEDLSAPRRSRRKKIKCYRISCIKTGEHR